MNQLFRAFQKIERDVKERVQHDAHYRAFLIETGDRGEAVVRMPNGLLERQEYMVDDRDQRWVFTDKGTPIFAGVE